MKENRHKKSLFVDNRETLKSNYHQLHTSRVTLALYDQLKEEKMYFISLTICAAEHREIGEFNSQTPRPKTVRDGLAQALAANTWI
jgi:hypothetical protein